MKHLIDLSVTDVAFLREDYVLISLTNSEGPMPACEPGQFVEIAVEGSPTTFLRRPISINWCDVAANRLDLLIHIVGDGTRALSRLRAGDTLNCLFPLGHGFCVPEAPGKHLLLVGGGVGTAPMLQYGKVLREHGHKVSFLLGGRSKKDLLQLERFAEIGKTYVTTEDGTLGETGFVTNHSILQQEKFDGIAACGPKPMMKAVAGFARANGVSCEVSLENMMACGLGACLCCVEKTVKGNVCVCKEGPVFDINDLTWFD